MYKYKIVLIAPVTFGFYQHIISALIKLGFEVKFLDEHVLSKSFFLNRIIFKLPNSFLLFIHRIIMLYKLRKDHDADFLFVIRGEYLDNKFFSYLDKVCTFKEKILYQWDFEKNLPLLKKQIPEFDHVYTFDKHDAKSLNLIHKPLFFNELHQQYSHLNTDCKYLVSFIGTHHSDRFEFTKLFLKLNPFLVKESFIYLLRSKPSFLFNKYLKGDNLGGLLFSDLNSEIINELDTIEILASSHAILDIHQPAQKGLTIRTFEALGLQKKLITTNPRVKNYDFYNPKNILVVDRENPVVSEEFMSIPFEPTPKEIYDKYLVTNWVREFFQ